MKKTFAGGCMAAVCSIAVGLSAQTGSMDKRQMDQKAMMKSGSVTVAGCVTQAPDDDDDFMLTNAMMTSGMMQKDMMKKDQASGDKAAGDQMAKDKMKDASMSGHDMMSSYELVGAEKELKMHVGHKVEVMGTMSKDDMKRMSDMHSMSGDKMSGDNAGKSKMAATGSMNKDAKPMKLNVQSVKMVSANCS